MKRTVYSGTYAQGGIYKVYFDEGRFGKPELFCAIDSPKYICKGGDFLVTLYKEDDGKAGVAVIDEKGSIVSKLAYEDVVSCYVTSKDDMIYTANFHEGTFSALKYTDGKIELIKKIKIRDKAGCHQLLFWKDYLLGFALYTDNIYIFDKDFECVGTISFPEGTGPRHGVFSEDGKYLYVVSELSNEVFIISAGDWKVLDHVQLCDDKKATSAAIRLDGNSLYVSVRGQDKVFAREVRDEKLKITWCKDCGGQHPRDMIFADGYCICANRFTGNLTSLGKEGVTDSAEVPDAVSLMII